MGLIPKDGIYYVELSNTVDGLSVNGNTIIETRSDLIHSHLSIVCNLDSKQMSICKELISPFLLEPIGTEGILDLESTGERWEGSIDNGYPCGYGRLFDEEGHLTYEGFFYLNQRVCYGKSFFRDIECVEYEGTFYMDHKHGYGILYDRKGECIREGYFSCDSVPNPQLVVHSTIPFHSQVERLTIDRDCTISTLLLTNLPVLQTVRCNPGSLKDVSLFSISRCLSLKEIWCERVIGNPEVEIAIMDCPELFSLYMIQSFPLCNKITLSSPFSYSMLSRPSAPKYTFLFL